MLKVRLQRVGRKNDPSFRVVVTDSRRGPKSGNYIENLGSYSPREKSLSLNNDRIKHWIAMGAQVSDTVHNLLVKEKVIDGKAINVLPKKSPVVKKEKGETEAPIAAAQAVQDSEESLEAARDDSAESEEKPEEEGKQKADEPSGEAINAEESTKEGSKAKDVKEEEESSDDSKEDIATSEEKSKA